MTTGDKRGRLGAGLLLAAGLALHGGLALHAAAQKSATFDEPLHLLAGYTHLRFRDYRLCPQHPPLVKSWAALPLLAAPVAFDTADEGWREGHQRKLSRGFLFRWNDADALLSRARAAMVAFPLALIAAVFVWTWRHLGGAAAACALVLAVFHPDLLAHGPLVTTDVPAALFFFTTVCAFERLTRRLSAGAVTWAGVSLGAALASKFSALVLLPILALLAIVGSRRPLELAVGRRRALLARRQRLLALGLALVAMTAMAAVVVWASFGFRSPEAYLRGLRFFAGGGAEAEQAHAGSVFAMGRLSDGGWWWYFLVTFLVKTPLPLLALVALAAARRPPEPRPLAVFLWTPVVVYAAVAVASRLNIGHRHLLPAYPFLFVLAGAAAARLLALPAARPGARRLAQAAVAALLAWSAAGALRLHPHHLAYFNELAGGPANGYRVLVDSNLDWGQDLKGLGRYMAAHGIERVALSYFGTAEPAYYGIAADRLPGFPPPAAMAAEVKPGDFVAVSATNLQGVRVERGRRLMRRLREQRPVGHIGHSILLFRPDFGWRPEQEGP